MRSLFTKINPIVVICLTGTLALAIFIIWRAIPEDHSQAPQVFFDPNEYETKYPFVRLQREPARLIETSLRPSPLVAHFPSQYMRSIGHPWEAIAEGTWDFAEFGFDLNTLAPAQIGGYWHSMQSGNNISVTLGGYDRTLRWLSRDGHPIVENDLMSSQAEENHPQPPFDYQVLYTSNQVELDGAPTRFKCSGICSFELTITPDAAGFVQEDKGSSGYGPSGTALSISFDAKLFYRWPEIRAKAICFAAAVIVGFDEEKAFPGHHETCEAVRHAIAAR